MNALNRSLLIIFLVLLADQCLKIWIKTHMFLGQEFHIAGDWFIIHFTENNGMAFGMELAGEYGKLFLSVFRLFAMVGIAWYLIRLAKKDTNPGLLWCIALILGGAIGNVVDSTFYGVFIPENVIYNAPTPWFHGQVIDMFYVDICYCYIPEWVPIFGGTTHALWPIFNVADSSIFLGVVTILLMQKSFFLEKEEAPKV